MTYQIRCNNWFNDGIRLTDKSGILDNLTSEQHFPQPRILTGGSYPGVNHKSASFVYNKQFHFSKKHHLALYLIDMSYMQVIRKLAELDLEIDVSLALEDTCDNAEWFFCWIPENDTLIKERQRFQNYAHNMRIAGATFEPTKSVNDLYLSAILPDDYQAYVEDDYTLCEQCAEWDTILPYDVNGLCVECEVKRDIQKRAMEQFTDGCENCESCGGTGQEAYYSSNFRRQFRPCRDCDNRRRDYIRQNPDLQEMIDDYDDRIYHAGGRW